MHNFSLLQTVVFFVFWFFFPTVNKFAKEVIEPISPKMDEEQCMSPDFIKELFANGVR
jgi:hypothetical protein